MRDFSYDEVHGLGWCHITPVQIINPLIKIPAMKTLGVGNIMTHDPTLHLTQPDTCLGYCSVLFLFSATGKLVVWVGGFGFQG